MHTDAFSSTEHEALRRLLTHALGYTKQSARIRQFLLFWQSTSDFDQLVLPCVDGVSRNLGTDMCRVAFAAKREKVRPSQLRREYAYSMRLIARRGSGHTGGELRGRSDLRP